MSYIVYKTVKFVVKPFFTLIHRSQYVGLNNIPKEGGVILAGNHVSNNDAILVPCGPKRVVHMMAKKELFKTRFTNAFFRSMACIRVDRSIHDESAKSEAIQILNDGKVLGIFPEGTINKTDKLLMPFKYGAVSFAKKTGCYIVPFAITGKYKIFKKSVKVTYGKPYKVVGDLESENKKLMKKVEDLIKKGCEQDD